MSSPLLIGVVHLLPLPGSPRYDSHGLGPIIARARDDVNCLLGAGFDGYVVENFGDSPFFKGSVPPWVLTSMTRVLAELPRKGALVGVNVLRNDAEGALAIAAAADAQFVRINVHVGAMVTDQGIIEGDAARIIRLRRNLAPSVRIFADVAVKHASPLGANFDLALTAEETAYRGMADGLIITGPTTGRPVTDSDLETVRSAVPDRLLLVGSGATAATAGRLADLCNGIIVGTSIKVDGHVDNPIDDGRAREFVEQARLAS